MMTEINPMFPQGRIPDKMIAQRCPWCEKYMDVSRRHHLKVCPNKPREEK
jgi:hypothetical protein